MATPGQQEVAPRLVSFPLGQLVITACALECLTDADVKMAIHRHSNGDWGDLETEDQKANDKALAHGGRLFSAYHSATGTKFWVITEWDRSLTTILLPEDY